MISVSYIFTSVRPLITCSKHPQIATFSSNGILSLSWRSEGDRADILRSGSLAASGSVRKCLLMGSCLRRRPLYGRPLIVGADWRDRLVGDCCNRL